MTNDDRGWVVSRLVPGPIYAGSFIDGSEVWLDTRPFPSEEAIETEYLAWQTELSKEVLRNEAHETYYATLEAGYTDSNGIVWYCNERAMMDLAMMVVLNSLNEEEPVYIFSMSHGVQQMTMANFKILAIEIGRYAYGVRRTLWTTLLNI